MASNFNQLFFYEIHAKKILTIVNQNKENYQLLVGAEDILWTIYNCCN